MKSKFYLFILSGLIGAISCEKGATPSEETLEAASDVVNTSTNFEYHLEEDGILSFESEELLANHLDRTEFNQLKADVGDLRAKGFVPLNPMFDENDNKLEEEYLSRRAKLAKENNFFYTGKDYSEEDADLEDDVIADPKFAAVLNESREIYVKNNFYVYTPYGLFFSKRKDRDHLRNYLKTLSSSPTGKSTASQLARQRDCNNMQKSDSHLSSKGTISSIDDKISYYSSCGGGGSGITIGGGGGGTSPTPSPNLKYPFEYKSDLSICSVKQNSLWQKVFGPAETCHSYFDGEKRLKSKFWSQSYLVYASIGTSVKYQKKYWLGWQTSNAIDFTEMGINTATFTYKRPVSLFDQTFKDIQNDVIIRWKNTIWTADGRQLTKLPFELPTWPFKNGTIDKFEIEIYIFDRSLNYDYKQAYKAILKEGKKFIESAGNKINGLQDAVNQDKVTFLGVTLVKDLDKIVVTVNERFRRSPNNCCNSYTFDRNFLVELKFSYTHGTLSVEKLPGGNFTGVEGGYLPNQTATWSPPIFVPKLDVFNATKYEDFNLDFYGVAKRGSVYRGNRVLGNSKEL